MADIDVELRNSLGPLANLLGTWEGASGEDNAPSPTRTPQLNRYRERSVYSSIGLVDNHEQRLFGLRYTTQAWKLGEVDPFHEEMGYWLWDPKDFELTRCFSIPRGISLIAGGTVPADAKSFTLTAGVGSEIYGICSNKFLHHEFRTLRFEIDMAFNADGSHTYVQNSQLWMKGKSEIFHHRDSNTLWRTD